MKSCKAFDSQAKEYLSKCIRDNIKLDLLNIYKNIQREQGDKYIATYIKQHRRLINKYNLGGKHRFDTLIILETYKNTKNRELAFAILTNTLNNRGLFSYFLDDAEAKEKKWNAKGKGHTC